MATTKMTYPKYDNMNARLGRLLRNMGVDTRLDPFATVLGEHKYAPRIRMEKPASVNKTLQALEIAVQRMKRRS